MLTQVLALEGAFDLGLSAILDIFSAANELAATSGKPALRFEVQLIGVRKSVRTSHGFQVPLTSPSRKARPDLVIVPALGSKLPASLSARLAERDIADAGELLRERAAAGARIAAACTGTFVLAESGLLEGSTATTSWWLGPMFRQRYSQIALDESRIIVDAKSCTTAGAALGHLDLALGVVRRKSPALAAMVARYLLVDPHLSQSPYMIPAHLSHTDPVVEKFEGWARRRLAQPFSLSAAASSAGTSERTLARRLKGVLGKSPLSYVQDLRVERAVHLLQTSDASVDEIAGEVGYEDGVTLRTLLRRKTGRGVRELRARA